MKQYLVFQLYAPLASWGEEAVGEVRHTATLPTRSAILGLLAAALGISRDEEARLNQFNRQYHIAIRPLSSQERWLSDYHTVSMPRENKKRRYYTRRDELTQAPDEINTIVSQREYRCDGYWHVAISAASEASTSLETLRDALLAPHYPLYLGRKSCPLALPLSPRLIDGPLKHVFSEAERELIAPELRRLMRGETRCYWDDPDEKSIAWDRQQHCYNQPVSRQRWQFESYIRYCGRLGEGE